uniref:Ketosynthase family 3 (KS3) domain-containing protein n=1 Tax=Alexandrium monilatum TaxID=311494 RepID=A0A7S4SYQ0_9DINO
MATLTQGALVEVHGLPGPAKPVPEASGVGEVDLNGQKAQLLGYDRNVKKWTAATFGGDTIAVDEKYVRPLGFEEISGYDFVFGPKSDFETVGSEMADTLATKGYAVMKLFVSAEDAEECVTVAKKLEDDDQFSRLAVEFERGYLGKDGSAKTLLLDPSSLDVPSYVLDSPLKMMDHNFGAISQMIGAYTQDAMGFDIYSRTNMLLRMPLAEGDEDKYPPADIDDGDAEGYLHTMARKRLTLLQFVGPTGGILRLHPLAEGGQEIVLPAEPGTVVLIVASRYEYSLEAEGESLCLTCFYMAEPAVYEIYGSVKGDTEVLGLLGTGPPPPPGEQVTVNSMYTRYGGGSDAKERFWSAAGKAATDGLTDVPFMRWDNSLYWDPDQTFGGTYTRHGCFGIEGVELFDCKFFEISPAEAKGMDPCQRQVMEVSYMALLEGGWDKRSLQRESQNIGHFVGIDKDDWMCMSAGGLLNLSGAHGAAAAANAITSNRFSYSLNLKGASMTIDTACSSSLVCTHVSKLHLRFKDFEPMPGSIVNGLNLMLYQGPFVGCCAAGMLSHEGRCFTFNATADGYARGELSGAACFKIKQYQNDGQVMACLAGSQANQDGRSASLTAPNGPAQEKCLNAVLRECHLTPTEVDCFECHGTGTSLGDPIEVGALRATMMMIDGVIREHPLVKTSSKSNIGHTELTAGLCGIIKCVMMGIYCNACPNNHIRLLNPHIDSQAYPVYFVTEEVDQGKNEGYMGVSSFGFGGSNARGDIWSRALCGPRSTDPHSGYARIFTPDRIFIWSEISKQALPQPGFKSREEGALDNLKDYEDAYMVGEQPTEDDSLYVIGSFNGWSMPEKMEFIEETGCYIFALPLGEACVEQFQICMNKNEYFKIFPASKMANEEAIILGPGVAPQGNHWVIDGRPKKKPQGTVYQITLQWDVESRKKTISWEASKDDYMMSLAGELQPFRHRYHIVSSWSNWKPVEMQQVKGEKPGTLETTVRVGIMRHEEFRIQRDADKLQSIYPARQREFEGDDEDAVWHWTGKGLEAIGWEAEKYGHPQVGSTFTAEHLAMVGADDDSHTFDSLAESGFISNSGPQSVPICGPDHLGEGKHWMVKGFMGEEVKITLRVWDGEIELSTSNARTGVRTWTNKQAALKRKYFVTGTWNDWSYSQMKSEARSGGRVVYKLKAKMTETRMMAFNIVLDEDKAQCIHPEMALSDQKLSAAMGPDAKGEGLYWGMYVKKGDKAEIKLDLSQEDRRKVVTWTIKRKD